MSRTTLFITAILLLLPAPLLSRAATPEVRDRANIFSPDTIAKANPIISQIKKDHGFDLMIETFPTIPAELKQEFDSTPDRNKFYDQWLAANARREGIRGVYVLIIKSPGHIQIGMGRQTIVKAFTPENRDTLRDLMLADFKDGQFDEGLLQGVDFVRRTMDHNLADTRTSPATRQLDALPGIDATTQPTSQPSAAVEFAPPATQSTQSQNVEW